MDNIWKIVVLVAVLLLKIVMFYYFVRKRAATVRQRMAVVETGTIFIDGGKYYSIQPATINNDKISSSCFYYCWHFQTLQIQIPTDETSLNVPSRSLT